MARTRYLSDAEKRLGQKYLYTSEIYNGLGFSMLGDTIVYILAVRFGASNLALGYIASAMYIVGIVLPIMARTFRGRNVVKVQTLTWYLRGLVSLGYLSLIWVQGNAGVTILLIVYTLFSLMRLVGVVMYDYTFKSITTNRTRGRVIGNANVAFQSSTVFARLLNFIVTSIQLFSGVMGLIALQMFGVINNTIAARYLSKIPCRTKVDYRKGRTLFTVLKESMRDSISRSRLLVFWYYMSVTVIMGMSIAFLTKVVGLESNIIFLYTIVISGSVILAGSFCTFFSDRLGSRPLIIANGFALMVTLIGWMIIPASGDIALFFVLGFLSNFFLANVNILIRRLLAAVIPDNDPVGFNSMTNFMIAFFALFSGLAGGYLANLSEHIQLFGHGWGNAYTFTFALALLFSLLALISTASLHEQGALSAKAAAQLMFSLHGLRAFINIDRLEKEKDPLKRKSLLLSLGKNLTGVATSEIRATLANPFSNDRAEVIRGLFDRPRSSLVDDLISDAFSTDSYTQNESIYALGAYRNNQKAEQALRYLLDNGSSLSRSNAAKSIARVTRTDAYLQKVEQMSDSAQTILEELNYLLARNIMDREGTFFKELFLSARQGRGARFRQTRYALIAYFLKSTPNLGELFEQKNLLSPDFLSEFLEESRDVSEIDQQRHAIVSAFNNREWERIWSICFSMVRDIDIKDARYSNLLKGILKGQTLSYQQTDSEDALAVLYFSYQVKKISLDGK
ncbi:MAG: MFS transporter [Sphaerochaetaceae bacterium]|nr:MFS transporter [Sphaerochaetaceae bacterium]